MIELRPAGERGHAHHGWLDTWHSFSFADYYDPAHMGVSVLRVLNDDRIAPASGFDTHPHRDMEIITVVLSGTVEHRDTMGFHTLIHAGEIQVMSAGSGILHSEHNPSPDEELHLLQIWILPAIRGAEPRYQQHRPELRPGWNLLVAPDNEAREGVLAIRQDARIWRARLQGEDADRPLDSGRTWYIHLATGAATLNGIPLKAGDGATLKGESHLSLTAQGEADALLFELP